ncbi:hypothetical protein [Actinospica robiniae]|uniref:hypothetical protein n=1 Tax=Actinospica robiniae TaxID=304901 RepID=UPI000421F300|nr:hypothetical protein [Actinospica robiniae]
MADDFKYHIDHHAGLVVPPALVEARAAHARGELGEPELREAEDQAIREALRAQRRLGLSALGDGQFRRRNSLSPVYDQVDGFAFETAAPGPIARLLGENLVPEIRTLVALPTARGRLVENEAAFLAGSIDRSLMLALPSPGYVLALSRDGGAGPAAGAEVAAALAAIIRDEIAQVAQQGIAYVLLQNPLAGILLTKHGREQAQAAGVDADELLDAMLAADAAVIDGLEARTPENFRVGLDLTAAGAAGAGAASGYDLAATTAFLDRQPYTRLCVEYPQDEASRFPLELLEPGTVVSLGVVDVADEAVEDVDELVDRIDKASATIDVDDIAISTNGSFAAAPAFVTEAQQHAKLQLVEMTARYFWGNEL